MTPFQIEHVVARQHGGRDAPGNLAFACLRCNLHKGPNLSGLDPTTQRMTALFHPRRHKWDRHFGWAGARIYDAACFLSLCVPVVAKRDKLDATRRQKALKFYGDAAVQLLRDAVTKGYKDVAQMKKDTDLDPLRQRDDFQKLVAQLEGRRK
jgi:hypothetical protein